MIKPLPNSNVFTRLYSKIVLDANNPLANLTNIPLDGANLSSFTDITTNRNVFVQTTPANQFQFKRNYVNGNHAVYLPGVTTNMTCPYDVNKNGYTGPLTITYFCQPDGDTGTGHLFGQFPLGDGFSVGQADQDNFFVELGVELYPVVSQFVTGEWAPYTIRYDGNLSLSFFKNAAKVDDVDCELLVAAANDFILGAFSTSSTNTNFAGHLNLLGFDNRAHTDAEIILAHQFALARLG
jgi:hypothetical protein